MNTIRNLPFLIREGIRNLWTNRLMSLSSIGVLGVCLLLISNAVLISANINAVVAEIGKDDAIIVYMQDGTTDEEAQAFEGKLLQLNNVSSVRYISSKEALDNWKDILKEYPDLLSGIEDDYLPPSFSISVMDVGKIDETVYQLGTMREIASIREMAELTSKLVSIESAISGTLYAIVAVLFIVSLFIIANTVKLAMFSRRKEISIMKYVGGTDWFIRLPFVVEGLLIGFLAGLLAFFVQWYLYGYIVGAFTSSLNFISVISFSDFSGKLVFWLCVTGAAIGTVGSSLSMRKYLQV